MCMMLADAMSFDASTITAGVSAIGSIGFVSWFGFHTTTVTLPTQAKEHREAMKEQADAFLARDKEKTDAHASTVKELVAELRREQEQFERWRSGISQTH